MTSPTALDTLEQQAERRAVLAAEVAEFDRAHADERRATRRAAPRRASERELAEQPARSPRERALVRLARTHPATFLRFLAEERAAEEGARHGR